MDTQLNILPTTDQDNMTLTKQSIYIVNTEYCLQKEEKVSLMKEIIERSLASCLVFMAYQPLQVI